MCTAKTASDTHRRDIGRREAGGPLRPAVGCGEICTKYARNISKNTIKQTGSNPLLLFAFVCEHWRSNASHTGGDLVHYFNFGTPPTKQSATRPAMIPRTTPADLSKGGIIMTSNVLHKSLFASAKRFSGDLLFFLNFYIQFSKKQQELKKCYGNII